MDKQMSDVFAELEQLLNPAERPMKVEIEGLFGEPVPVQSIPAPAPKPGFWEKAWQHQAEVNAQRQERADSWEATKERIGRTILPQKDESALVRESKIQARGMVVDGAVIAGLCIAAPPLALLAVPYVTGRIGYNLMKSTERLDKEMENWKV